jgi:ribonuclease HII
MNKQEKEEYLREKLFQMKKFENALYEKGISVVAGVDEVGRGPLAGPVVAVCVVLPKDFSVLGIDDSKKVPEKKREDLFLEIKNGALAFGVGIVDNNIIDDINILEATKLAMKIAINEANSKLKIGIEHVLIDALTLKDVEIPQTGIIKGDSKSVSIAAASIVAKVIRDNMMRDFHKEYPFYAFDRNKGYGTLLHYEGLKKSGYCEIHRKTFIKQYLTGE